MSMEKYSSIFLEPEGGYCVYYASNIFCSTRDLKIGECHSDTGAYSVTLLV